MPAAAHIEKDGTFTQTQRMLQWHHKAVDPPGDCRSELHFFFQLGRKLRERLANSTDERDRPLLDLAWDYPVDELGEPSADAVLAEINGFHLTGEKAGQPLSSFVEMRDDGSTSGGCWIYTGVYATVSTSPSGGSLARSSRGSHPNGAGRGRRTGACCTTARRPTRRDDRGASARHTSGGMPMRASGPATTYRISSSTGRPDSGRRPTPPASPHLAGDDPFIMQADGKGWLYVPAGLRDGPLPAHYEPSESPVRNPFYRQQANPARQVFPRKDNYQNPSPPEPGSDVYPFVFTTYRLTEHHTAGGMSRFLPYLSELQPEFFCEVSPELARLA